PQRWQPVPRRPPLPQRSGGSRRPAYLRGGHRGDRRGLPPRAPFRGVRRSPRRSRAVTDRPFRTLSRAGKTLQRRRNGGSMGLFNRSRTSVASDEPAAGRGYGRNAVRGIFTLAGIIAAGVLVWLAHYPNLQHAGGFWGAMGLLAGAGLVLGLSQLFGGWTKWGMPKISLGVL